MLCLHYYSEVLPNAVPALLLLLHYYSRYDDLRINLKIFICLNGWSELD